MDDQKTQPRGLPGWLKTLGGTLAGLLSGAAMMYLSPLLDKAIRPAKPVANFRVESQGLTITFHNLSAGGRDGWWDFGDGSPLEPFSAKQESYTHVFARPDSYNVKLTVRNVLGEENDRTVPVVLSNVTRDPPVIDGLEVVSVSPGDYAPATFRVTSRARNAELAVWDFGDDRPLQFSTDAPNTQDQFVTFKEPGGYKIKLTAINGKQAVYRDAVVYVQVPPSGTLTAYLNVTDVATRAERVERVFTLPCQYPGDASGGVAPLRHDLRARPGYRIADYHILQVEGSTARNLQLQVAADQQSAVLTGDLVQPVGLLNATAPPPTTFVKLQITEERSAEATRPVAIVAGNLPLPGTVLLPMPPLPAGWSLAQRQMQLELHDGDQVVWKQSQADLPRNLSLEWHGQHWTVTAMPSGDQLRVEMASAKAAAGPAAN